MTYYKDETKSRNDNRPHESGKLTDNVQVALWIRESDEGKRFNIQLGRVNPNDENKPYRSFRPSDLLELPQAVSTLASALSNAPLPSRLCSQLAELADLMDEASRAQRAGRSERKENGHTASVLAS